MNVKYRHLKNGSKLRVVLESLYNKDDELRAVQLRFDIVLLQMEIQQPELELEDGRE